jgi:flagellar motor switch protein FliN/FliY
VTERTGAEISVAGTQEVSESQAAGDGQVAIVAISHERLFLRFSPEWSMVLTPRDGLDKLAQAVGSATQVPPVSTAIATSGDGPGSGMSVLLDVELPVSVSFGKTRLPLKDVLKLTTGSVIELNRVVNEPVEVVVNNCVVATGDVVMVDGNYGVRIRKVLSSGSRVDNYALRRKVAAR